MPLDHVNGENIDTLGIGQVVPVNKWMETQYFGIACEYAAAAFVKSGALMPLNFDQEEIIVQEYPHQNRLAFVFCKQIAGKERLVPCVFKLDGPQIADLVNSGRWVRPN